MKIFALLISALVLLGGHTYGESRDCLNPDIIVPDGRLATSQFEASVNGVSPTYWYGFYGQLGHSYSIEFVPSTDNENGNTSIRFVNFFMWGPNDIVTMQQNSCRGSTSLSWTSTRRYAPVVSGDIYGTGQRSSLVQPTSGLNIMSITNSQGAGSYFFRVTDTTMFNPRWSTFSGFDTQWGFTNMSDMPIQGTLTVYNTANQQLAAVQITIPPNGQIFRSSGATDVNLQRNASGYAVFSHNGPPRAILADSYMLNSSATVVIYAKFETRYSD